MRLYHYTAQHHIDGGNGHPGPGILRTGLMPNIHPYIDLMDGMVWLTDSAEWTQTWSTRDVPVPGFGLCNRTEVRIEVVIPKHDRVRLKPWREVSWRVLIEDMRRDLETFGDPEHWYVYVGRIPPSWIRGIERNGRMKTA